MARYGWNYGGPQAWSRRYERDVRGRTGDEAFRDRIYRSTPSIAYGREYEGDYAGRMLAWGWGYRSGGYDRDWGARRRGGEGGRPFRRGYDRGWW